MIKKKLCIFVFVLAAAFAAAALLFVGQYKSPEDVGKTIRIFDSTPILSIETPQKINPKETDTVLLDVSISDLGEEIYPAASMSISFDSSRLEFLGISEGNLFVHGDLNAAGIAQKLPEWSCNTQVSNDTGLINIMYLDMTGGKYGFDRELLSEDDNIVFRLGFRLRGSVRSGDILDIIIEDAVFAASDETKSLAVTAKTLDTKNGRIVIGE